MKNKALLFLLLFLLLVFNSCIKVNGDFKGLYSYYENTNKSNPELFVKLNSSDSICMSKSENNDKIYIVNGTQLKECLNKNKKSIVYLWSPKCKSDVCFPLEIIQSFCSKNNLSLFIVSEYYDAEIMASKYTLERNILAVDTKYYKTNLVSSYVNRFMKDIDAGLERQIVHRYLYFEGDRFVRDYRSVYDYNPDN
jgi:hypothetical protein